jgi:hypothetical protein
LQRAASEGGQPAMTGRSRDSKWRRLLGILRLNRPGP